MIYIKYSGTIPDRKMIRMMEEEFIDISMISGWSHEVVSENFQTMTKKVKDDLFDEETDEEFGEEPGEEEKITLSSSDVYLDGIIVDVAEDMDPLAFTFDRRGKLATISFHAVKTKGLANKLTVKKYEFLYYPYVKIYTNSFENHRKIVKILDYVKKTYIKDLEVLDTSFYWENRDIEDLKVRMWKAAQKQTIF
ncbi:MAG: hypothetical protein ACLFP1_03710 [Candidatus Goldiibacteriota bacterium]